MAQLGEALPLSDDDLDRLAEITPEDIVLTNQKWLQYSSPWAKNLLLADSPEADEEN